MQTKVEDINRFAQISVEEHPQFFQQVRLGEKRRQPKRQAEYNKNRDGNRIQHLIGRPLSGKGKVCTTIAAGSFHFTELPEVTALLGNNCFKLLISLIISYHGLQELIK